MTWLRISSGMLIWSFKGKLTIITALRSEQIEKAQLEKDDKEIQLTHENRCTSTITSTLPDEQLSTQTGQDPDVQIKGKNLSFSNDVFNH